MTTGRSKYLEELRAQYPPGIFELLRVPGLGLKKIGILHAEFGIAGLDDLEAAARDGRIAKLPGFGAKMQQKILEGIETARRRTSQFLLPAGLEIGELVRERMTSIAKISDAEVSGSVRRRLETGNRVDVVVAASDVEAAIAATRKQEVIDRLEVVGEMTLGGTGRDEIEVRLHFTKPADFGCAMLVTTGSPEFVDAFATRIAKDAFELRGLALFHKGRHVTTANERDLFERVGIPFVDPERRESADILARKTRVHLVEPNDLKGTFHVHTTFSDGRNTVAEMLGAARDRGFDYVGLSDHSQNAYYAHGLTPDDLRKQHAEIDARRAGVAPMRVFRGTEADILDDGRIDYGPKTLAGFDFVIASVHSRFGMDEEKMTERMLRALDDPFVTILGHLTGRLLLNRKGYSIDFDRIFDRAAERGVMIEINGNPNRLELDWRLVHRAIDRGVLLCINPDAHSINELSYVISGTWVARKAGLSPRQIFNTRPVDEVAEHLARRRERAIAQKG
jgi:DNA polymerase (family 10)